MPTARDHHSEPLEDSPSFPQLETLHRPLGLKRMLGVVSEPGGFFLPYLAINSSIPPTDLCLSERGEISLFHGPGSPVT